ncbi:signal peptidase I [Chloroflexota bacterium]
MKRAIGLIILIAVFVMAILSIRGTMPFMPIFGSSMEPTLQSGGLLIIEPVDPTKVEVGDIIIYKVSSYIRDYYNYPPTVAHRVIEIREDHPGLRFRTKGDNTGEDPFSIMPQDIRGTVGDQIPYLGMPLLFFQSQQGTIFVIIALALLALFLYSDELSLSGRKLQRGVFSPVIRESYRTNRVMVEKIEGTEQRMNSTERALEKFSQAIELYAQHLASHTSAIQGLAEASHELKNGAAEQNKVLAHLMQNLGNLKPDVVLTPTKGDAAENSLKITPATEADKETPLPKDRTRTIPPGCIKGHQVPVGQTHGHKPFSVN